ncbi:MAG: magnesium transporter [Spirochaetota bacterium]
MSNQLRHYVEYHEKMTPQDRQEYFNELPFSDLVEQWEELSDDEALLVFIDLPLQLKTDLIPELSHQQQEQILLRLTEQSKKNLFKMMEPDDLVDIMQTVGKEVRDSVWKNLSDSARREMVFLLRYDEDDAAGLMTPRFLAVQASITVRQAIYFIRKNSKKVEYLFSVYVIDKLQRLTGVVSMRDLLAAEDNQTIKDIMEENVDFAYDDTDQEEVARIMETNDIASLPVVSHDHVLIGIVTFDDIIDVIREEQTEDIYRMGAMSSSQDPYVRNSILGLVKMRVPWLILLLLFGTISANVLHYYEPLMIGATFLVIFMPVIVQTGGNTGNQASALMIRGLATGEIQFREVWKIAIKEILIGALMGLITGIVIILRSIFLPPGIGVYEGLVVGLSLMIVVLISNLVGIFAPLGIARLGKDPTVMSAPLIATLIDVAGYAIYFETARLLLNL